uniref:CRAL/TRIO N-terminal domain-containing protein n=1 Tax=Ananas comosus var. bracteatus TaxID=296719 RepID=A0A6V7NQP3_ANACO|nr:unnamed protein product [Ananas comosus var. bracteatus]
MDASNDSEPGSDPVTPLGDLRPSEKKALAEFRTKLEEAIITNRLFSKLAHRHHRHDKSKTRVANACSPDFCMLEPSPDKDEDLKNISLWGIPLLPSKGHEDTDAVLLKFLQAREFRVSEAFHMLRRTLRWRRGFGADDILFEDLELPELNSAAYMDGTDKYGHPICYNVYGVFRDKELYDKAFGNEERRERFVQWRIRLMEEGIKQLSFKQGAWARCFR